MFESDDFDQVLSQFELPGEATKLQTEKENVFTKPKNIVNTSNTPSLHNAYTESRTKIILPPENNSLSPELPRSVLENKNKDIRIPSLANASSASSSKLNRPLSPKHTKRKIINSYFDHNNKRKFPGPAGLLTGELEEPNDESICDMELFSQDIDFTQNHLRRDLFESPLWNRLLQDVKDWDLQNIDSVKTIKQQALSGNLRRRKAQTVTAFVETVDRSVTDPLVILRDSTGTIKCTLHRDAWSTFSPYIVSEYCALVLWKPTVLTTGSAFKKHYLNITLSNILALYSSAVLTEEVESKILPDGYVIVSEDDFTVIKMESCPEKIGADSVSIDNADETKDLFDDLDNIFSEDIF